MLRHSRRSATSADRDDIADSPESVCTRTSLASTVIVSLAPPQATGNPGAYDRRLAGQRPLLGGLESSGFDLKVYSARLAVRELRMAVAIADEVENLTGFRARMVIVAFATAAPEDP